MTSETEVDDEADQEEEDDEAQAFDGEPIAGHTAVTAEDFKAVWARLPQNRSAMTTFGLMALGIPTLAVVQLLLSGGGLPPPMRWLYVLAPVMIALALARGLWKGRLAWANNAVKDMRSLEGVEFRFDADGMTIDAPGRKATTAWSALAHCLEMPDAFVIYTTPVTVMVVPKRAFAVADQPRLQALLLARVPNKPLRGVRRYPLRALVIWVVLIVIFLATWQILSPK